MHLYDDPPLYDALHTRGTAQELDGVERIVRRHRRGLPRAAAAQTWLEPACGTGRFVRLAARRGHRVLGFDINPAMVAYARQGLRRRGLLGRARVFVAGMTHFAARVGRDRVDVAFNLINSIRHLQTDAQMLAHLRQVASVLRPPGVYVVGMSLSRYGIDQPEEDVWEAVRGRVRLQQWVQYLPPGGGPGAGSGASGHPGPGAGSGPIAGGRAGKRQERVISHVIVTCGTRIQHHDDSWALRCYDETQWRRIIARSPLRIVEVCDAHGDPVDEWQRPYVVFVLQRVR